MAKSKKKTKGRQVHVRMYCQGLGDCFLLRLETGKDEFFHMLIDCGIYKASPDAGDIMRAIVDDIAQTTDGRLDVLVSTHEHWDHISGFSQALDKFSEMTIGETWLAWTENPKDAMARDLRKKYEGAKAKLVGLMASAQANAGAAASAALDEAYTVMGFFGVDKTSDESDAYADIKKLMESKNSRYFDPGAVEQLGGTGVKAFILGPPRSESALRKTEMKKGEGYDKQHFAFFDSVEASLGAVTFALDGATESERSFRPFDSRSEIPVEAARQSDFFQSLYGFEPDHAEHFRSIDDLAYGTLGHLALRMDNYTNNTSLVIALQLPSGEVLLFPGDAQGGNWRSWADLEKPLSFDEEQTDAHKLLAATVLYKVGHHGSHNATPKTFGLDLMTHPDLRALVPVDHEVATSARYGEMPLKSILDDLENKTAGAVFRADGSADGLPKGVFSFSKTMLKIKTTKDGEYFSRPMWVETSFDLD
jgi:hypothetical protein